MSEAAIQAHGMVEHHPKDGLPVWSSVCPKHNRHTSSYQGASMTDDGTAYLLFRCGKLSDQTSHIFTASIPEGAPLKPADMSAWMERWKAQKLAEASQPRKGKRKMGA
jgi:hypothetical protein